MNTQFENRYFSTDKMLSEYVYKVLLKKQRTTALVLSFLSGVILLFTLYVSNYVLSAVYGVCLLMTISVTILSPVLTIRQVKESAKRINNGQIYEIVVTFGENISISEGTFSLTIEYSQILKTYHLKHSYVLMFGKHNAIILCPDSFTVGNFEDFLAFVEQKVTM